MRRLRTKSSEPAENQALSLAPMTAYLVLFLLAIIWSSSFAAIKVGVETIGPMTLAAVRIVIAAVVLSIIVKIRGESLSMPVSLWAPFFAMGLLGNGLPFFLIGWGEVVVDSALAAILMAIMPLGTLLLAHIFTHDEKLTTRRFLGVLCGFGGVAVLVGADVLAGLGENAIRQAAIAGGAICYAIATIVAKKLPEMSVFKRAALTMIFAALQAVVLAFVLEQPLLQSPSAASWSAALYLGIFPTALATVLYFVLISARGATFIALINYVIPILGVFWGFLFFQETLAMRAFFALALILFGIWLTTRRQSQKSKSITE